MNTEDKIILHDLLSKLKAFNELDSAIVSKVVVSAAIKDTSNAKIYKEILAVSSSIWYNNESIDKIIAYIEPIE